MVWVRLNNCFQKEFALTIDTFNKVNLFFCFVCMIPATLNYNEKKSCLFKAVRGNMVSAWSFSLVGCEVLIAHKIVAPSCGMFLYKDLASQVTNSAPGGSVCLLLNSIILRRKSLLSLRWEGRFSTSGRSWSSTHLERFVVAELIVLKTDGSS